MVMNKPPRVTNTILRCQHIVCPRTSCRSRRIATITAAVKDEAEREPGSGVEARPHGDDRHRFGHSVAPLLLRVPLVSQFPGYLGSRGAG
jgi:hypothetical protein